MKLQIHDIYMEEMNNELMVFVLQLFFLFEKVLLVNNNKIFDVIKNMKNNFFRNLYDNVFDINQLLEYNQIYLTINLHEFLEYHLNDNNHLMTNHHLMMLI